MLDKDTAFELVAAQVLQLEPGESILYRMPSDKELADRYAKTLMRELERPRDDELVDTFGLMREGTIYLELIEVLSGEIGLLVTRLGAGWEG